MVIRTPAAIAALFVSIVALASVGGSACFRDAAADSSALAETGAPTPAAAKPAPHPPAPAVLAEATNPDAPVVVQVLEAKRATADTVRVTLAFTHQAGKDTPEPPSSASAPSASAAVPLFGGADPADFCLITPDGARRLFLLRDSGNTPVVQGNLEPLAPGDRRVVQATFPAPPAQAAKVSLMLGKLVLRDVPISD